jgi:hypothetical protein
MLNIEPYIVETIAHLAMMRSPVNVKTGLQLANSIIEGKFCLVLGFKCLSSISAID